MLPPPCNNPNPNCWSIFQAETASLALLLLVEQCPWNRIFRTSSLLLLEKTMTTQSNRTNPTTIEASNQRWLFDRWLYSAKIAHALSDAAVHEFCYPSLIACPWWVTIWSLKNILKNKFRNRSTLSHIEPKREHHTVRKCHGWRRSPCSTGCSRCDQGKACHNLPKFFGQDFQSMCKK